MSMIKWTRGDHFKDRIVVGQRVYCGLHGGIEGVIGAVYGQESPETIRCLGGGVAVMGGSADYDVIFEDHISRHLPECILRGVQWEIIDEIETKEFVAKARIQAEEAERKAAQDRESEEKRRAEERIALAANYPKLKPGAGAANIKTELKKAFPGVIFSVKTRRNAIDINWTDGPSVPEVQVITGKYVMGSFDGMTDCYNFDHSNVWTDVFGGALYVFANRHYTPERFMAAASNFGVTITCEEADTYGVTNLPMELKYQVRRTMAEASYL